MNFFRLFSIFLASVMSSAVFGATSVSQFGAKGDGVTDDSTAIQKAFDSKEDIFFEKKIYCLNKTVYLKNSHSKKIDFTGAVIIKKNRDASTVRIIDSSDIHITGGTFVIGSIEKPEMPEKYTHIDAHTFFIIRSDNISISNTHINGSGQMGICSIESIGLLFENNTIENCYRDGIYCHYCSDVCYLYNRISNVKDDALSFHDYGIPKHRARLIAAGRPQGGNLVVIGNITQNTYQGVASIGCRNVTIVDNIINNTVNGGICVFNSDRLWKGSDAKVNGVIIANNQITNAGKTHKIITREYNNGLDTCTARAAICAQSQGMDHLMPTATRRLSDVAIFGNVIRDCGVAGIAGHFVDNLSISNNMVINCNAAGKESTGNIIETIFCTNVRLSDNMVIDNRSEPKHIRGWAMFDSTGVESGSMVKGFLREAGNGKLPAPKNWNK